MLGRIWMCGELKTADVIVVVVCTNSHANTHKRDASGRRRVAQSHRRNWPPHMRRTFIHHSRMQKCVYAHTPHTDARESARGKAPEHT